MLSKIPESGPARRAIALQSHFSILEYSALLIGVVLPVDVVTLDDARHEEGGRGIETIAMAMAGAVQYKQTDIDFDGQSLGTYFLNGVETIRRPGPMVPDYAIFQLRFPRAAFEPYGDPLADDVSKIKREAAGDDFEVVRDVTAGDIRKMCAQAPQLEEVLRIIAKDRDAGAGIRPEGVSGLSRWQRIEAALSHKKKTETFKTAVRALFMAPTPGGRGKKK